MNCRVTATRTRNNKPNTIMKKLLTLLACALCAAFLTTSTVAAEGTNSLFNSNEYGLTLGTGYNVDTEAAFQQDYTLNINAGAFWYPFRNLGFEATVPFYAEGVSVQEVQAGTVLRLPLPGVFKNFAPYAGLGGVYNWKTSQDWAYIAKAGVEFRLNKSWGIFAEGQYRNSDFEWSNGQTSVNGGLRLVF